jgi:hypothetical protein
MDQSIQERVVARLSEFGLPIPSDIIQTTLMRDGYFVGWKFRYDGGYAILYSGSDNVEFHDNQDNVLKSVALGTEREAA